MNSRAKGCRGEREVAGLIAEWWTPVEAAEFVRTPSSGGWATPKLRGEFKAAGDLMTTAARWPFTVEVKLRNSWERGRLLAGRPSPVWLWWEQASKSAAEEGRHPMLWIRKNHAPWDVMLPLGIVKASWGLDVVTWARFPVIAGGSTLKPEPRITPCLVAWAGLRGVAPEELAGPLKGAQPALRLVAGG